MASVSVSVSSEEMQRHQEELQQNGAYNLSTSGKSELQSKLEQRLAMKESSPSPHNSQLSPFSGQVSHSPRRLSPHPGETTVSVVVTSGSPGNQTSGYENQSTAAVYARGEIDYSDEGNRAALELENTNMSEGNMAAMALTTQENLDNHTNGLNSDEDVTAPRVVKSEDINEDAINYSTEGNVYTQLGGPSSHGDRSHQLTTIDSSYLSVSENSGHQQGTSQSALSAALRSGYTVHNLTQLQPPGHVATAPATFDNAGHLLPQADVEAFFSDMERPMATTVTLAGMYPTGSGQFTTLTNTPGLTLAQTYQGNQGHGTRLAQLQPPSYSDNQQEYGLTQLYQTRQGLVPAQYMNVGAESGSRCFPSPPSISRWVLSNDGLYSSSSPNPVQKYSSYSSMSDGGSRDGVMSAESGLDSQYSRAPVQTATGSPYSSYMQQDVNSSTWYQNVPSPYSDVRPTGEYISG